MFYSHSPIHPCTTYHTDESSAVIHGGNFNCQEGQSPRTHHHIDGSQTCNPPIRGWPPHFCITAAPSMVVKGWWFGFIIANATLRSLASKLYFSFFLIGKKSGKIVRTTSILYNRNSVIDSRCSHHQVHFVVFALNYTCSVKILQTSSKHGPILSKEPRVTGWFRPLIFTHPYPDDQTSEQVLC